MQILRKYKLGLIGLFVGAIGGYMYYYFVGCENGTCAITSKPWNSTLYGAIVGVLLFTGFSNDKKKSGAEKGNTESQK